MGIDVNIEQFGKETMNSLCTKAHEQFRAGQLREAYRNYAKALEIFEWVDTPASAAYEIYIQMIKACMRLKEYDQGLCICRKMAELGNALSNSAIQIDAYMIMSTIFKRLDKLDDAMECVNVAYSVAASESERIRVLQEKARTLYKRGSIAEAKCLQLNILELHHVELQTRAFTYFGLSFCYSDQYDLEMAYDSLINAYNIGIASSIGDYNIAIILYNIALVYVDFGYKQEALILFGDVYKLFLAYFMCVDDVNVKDVHTRMRELVGETEASKHLVGKMHTPTELQKLFDAKKIKNSWYRRIVLYLFQT